MQKNDDLQNLMHADSQQFITGEFEDNLPQGCSVGNPRGHHLTKLLC